MHSNRYREDGRNNLKRPLLPYYITIPEKFEHTDIHLQLKKLVAKDGGIVVIDREDKFLRRSA